MTQQTGEHAEAGQQIGAATILVTDR